MVDSNEKIEGYFVKERLDGYYAVGVADLVFQLIAAVQVLQKKVALLEAK